MDFEKIIKFFSENPGTKRFEFTLALGKKNFEVKAYRIVMHDMETIRIDVRQIKEKKKDAAKV